MPVYRLDLAYDGSGFHGYARQADRRTVQGELEHALARVVAPLETVAAGRTDAGVHARGQVVSFETDEPVDPDRLARSLNRMLNPEIAVDRLVPAADDFNARFSAVSRTYRYRIDARPVLDPLLRRQVWHVPHTLDIAAMQASTDHLVGEHDFASFCRKAGGRSTVRLVHSARWTAGALVEFEITASSFCHQMVRSVVALCVDAGRGRVAAGSVPGILAARDRNAARGAAPPHGLILWSVAYHME